MIPRTLSATSIATFESCPARYKAEVIDRVPRIDGSAGLLGSACHEVLEIWVKDGYYLREWDDIMQKEKALNVLWTMVYPQYFSERTRFAEGWLMLLRWLQRTEWDDREVISTEVKSTFPVPTSVGEIGCTYIWDRCDRLLDSGFIEVVDYKSVAQPIQPDQLKHKIQPRLYALAAAIQFKGAAGIWITYDLLRYDTVSARFDRDDNVDTWTWLKAQAERIIASDGTEEKLNPECRWCVRKQNCETLKKHGDGGGVLGIANLGDAIDRRAQLKYAFDGMKSALDELDEHILAMCDEEELVEFETPMTKFKIASSGRRNVDSAMVAHIIGPELMSQYGKIGVTDVDALLKDGDLTDSQKSQIRQLIKKVFGKATVKTEPKIDFEED